MCMYIIDWCLLLFLLVSLMVESENSYIAWDFSLVQGKISMVLLFEPQFVSPLYNLKSFDCFSCLVLLPSSEFCLIIIGMSRLFSLRSYYSDCLRIHENCVFFSLDFKSRVSQIVSVCPPYYRYNIVYADVFLARIWFIFIFALSWKPIYLCCKSIMWKADKNCCVLIRDLIYILS